RARGTTRTQTRRWNGGVRTVGERLREANYAQDWQAQFRSQATARQQDGAAAFRLNEPATTTVIGTREVLVVNALGFHLAGIRRGRHIAEARNAFNRQVINTAGDHEISLAQTQFIHALFDRDSRGRTRGNRVNHLAITADISLHDVR